MFKKKKNENQHRDSTNKIINNESYYYGAEDLDVFNFKFEADFSVLKTDEELEELSNYDDLFREVYEFIQTDKDILKIPDKPSKTDINIIYKKVITKFPNHPKIKLSSIVQEYLKIDYTKFYTNLSITYRTQLVEELGTTPYGKMLNSINNLF